MSSVDTIEVGDVVTIAEMHSSMVWVTTANEFISRVSRAQTSPPPMNYDQWHAWLGEFARPEDRDGIIEADMILLPLPDTDTITLASGWQQFYNDDA